MTKTTRNVRLAQIIGPFGPGAIIDLTGESFVAEDAGRWVGQTKSVVMPRLAARLEVHELRSPSDFPGIPYYRFPTWQFCRRCRLMSRRFPRQEVPGEPPMCTACPDLALVPMRFVAVCADGHLSDIDWGRWAHRDPKNRAQAQCADKTRLNFISRTDRGSGLESLEILCRRCNAVQHLRGVTSVGTIRESCSGKQPWQHDNEAETCLKPLVGTQRGASNVYFPEIVSALDLPPDSDWEQFSSPLNRLRSNEHFRGLVAPRHPMPEPIREGLVAYLATAEELSIADVERAIVAERATLTSDQVIGTEADIIPEEWHALTNPQASGVDHRDHFVTRRVPRPGSEQGEWRGPTDLGRILSDVILVDRLREVRVLKGFRRYDAEKTVSANLKEGRDFLPAVEVFGEGFFLTFDEAAVRDWESGEDVLQQCRRLQARAQRAQLRWLPPITARYLMLHTFAHLLLRSTAFDAGYPVSALRERVYATSPDGGPDMAGILVYTAAGDAEGTLGGLTRVGEPERLGTMFMNALIDAGQCSLDPVCGESTSQGPGGLSLAACHACTLLPETSCQAGNRLLDRNLVIHPEIGFLAGLAAEVEGLPGRGTW
jgi:hypothetical protein